LRTHEGVSVYVELYELLKTLLTLRYRLATLTSCSAVGFEFETGGSQIQFRTQKSCTGPQTQASKGKTVTGHGATDLDWELTGDVAGPGALNAEYILNGKRIKIGSGAAVQAATDAAQDLVSCTPPSHITSYY